MAEYIEREAVIQYLLKCADGYSYIEIPTESAIADIKSISAADVRPVVLCRDCKHAEESMVSGCVYCNEMERARINEGWCAWGEKREES